MEESTRQTRITRDSSSAVCCLVMTMTTTSPSTTAIIRRMVRKPRVVIVGAGPAGLFCALQLARSGRITPVVLEQGQPVEAPGRDIGALVHRRALDPDSNFAFVWRRRGRDVERWETDNTHRPQLWICAPRPRDASAVRSAARHFGRGSAALRGGRATLGSSTQLRDVLPQTTKSRVVIVRAGPAGLFCALNWRERAGSRP